MLRLRVIQAEFGDCMILEYGTDQDPKYLLIDGGPETIYHNHLRYELSSISSFGRNLELVVVSHVDNDHITGILDLFSELRQQQANRDPEFIGVRALWHNSFGRTIDPTGEIRDRLKVMVANSGQSKTKLQMTSLALDGVAEGSKLRLDSKALSIPVNPSFPTDIISTDDTSGLIISDNLRIRIVGPTKQNLEQLRKDWIEWLDNHENANLDTNPQLAEYADKSIPNLSSIMFFAEADGKTILFTGDGRGDHLLDGLKMTGLMGNNGMMIVDVLKLPHHGSNRNVNKEFFEKVVADKYIVSANGRYGNPDLDTLKWIVESAKERHQEIEILATNETEATRQLRQDCNADDYGYKLNILQKSAHSFILDLG
jgi:beta-lactamase superfamily II metal-dependent hydrolase